jgi:hypothetical protein
MEAKAKKKTSDVVSGLTDDIRKKIISLTLQRGSHFTCDQVMTMLARIFDKATKRDASDMCLIMVSHANAPRKLVSQAMQVGVKYPKEVIIESTSGGARTHNYNNSAMTLAGEVIMDVIKSEVPHIADIVKKQGLSITGVPREAPDGVGRDIRDERSKIYINEWSEIKQDDKTSLKKLLSMVIADLNGGSLDREVDGDAAGVIVQH